MKCKWKDCDNEARAKSPYCGGTCKKRDQRLSGTNVPVEVGQEASGTKRDNPAHEDSSGSTNADETILSIPRYSDVHTEPVVDQPDTSQLPDGVSKPTGQRTTKTSTMTSQQLSASVRACKGTTWIASPEYAETIYRLQTLTTEELEEQGQAIPCWKVSA